VKRTDGRLLNILSSLIASWLLASFGLASAQEARATVPGITNFAKVNDLLYRGAQPKSDGIKSLARLGVRTIINLRMTNDVWSAEEAEARALGITYTNVPMSGIGRPTDQQVAKVLLIIETGTKPVFVHCQHGADRTGTIIACYRIQHDKWPSKQALQEAKKYGMSPLEIGMKRYVVDFGKSHKSE
jgi:protein tyrosine/serine phosphatase